MLDVGELGAEMVAKDVLREHRLLWYRKGVLRVVYEDYYWRIVSHCVDGKCLEVGGGSGNLKEYLPEVVSTDIVHNDWLDATASAQALPFGDKTFENIVGVDVLHHLEEPRSFLEEAVRVLRPGGRVVLVEPAITFLSWAFYRYAHPEPMDLSADPLARGTLRPNRLPFDANQAIPSLLFCRQRRRFEQTFPSLSIVKTEHLSFLVYPLSGGFRPWCLVPNFLVRPLLRFERALAPVVGKTLGFRLFVVLERV